MTISFLFIASKGIGLTEIKKYHNFLVPVNNILPVSTPAANMHPSLRFRSIQNPL